MSLQDSAKQGERLAQAITRRRAPDTTPVASTARAVTTPSGVSAGFPPSAPVQQREVAIWGVDSWGNGKKWGP